MKKKLLLGAAGIVALLLVLFGREALDLYRLMAYLDASTAAYEAEGGPWPQLADTCLGCHGVDGNSVHPAYPSLAGQPAAYLASQLQNFASGQRADPNMGPLAMTLTADEARQLADHFARQPAQPVQSSGVDAAVLARGQHLVGNGGCTTCHGESLMGRDQNPRLAGQGDAYLAAQLDAYATGARRDPSGVMNALVAAVPDDDRKAMAVYLSRLPPAQP